MTSPLLLTRATISTAATSRLIEAAAKHAAAIEVPMVIAVVDESGVLKAFHRMDGAPLLSVQLAQDKAWTAASYGLATHAWHDFIVTDPPLLHGIIKTPRLIVFGGGYPVEIDGVCVGGIGVSGGHYSQDMEVAQAGLAALAAT